jgi:hypothetical protein
LASDRSKTVGNPIDEVARVRPNDGDLMAVRTGIGEALRALHSDISREEIPNRVAELLQQIQQKDTDGVAS